MKFIIVIYYYSTIGEHGDTLASIEYPNHINRTNKITGVFVTISDQDNLEFLYGPYNMDKKCKLPVFRWSENSKSSQVLVRSTNFEILWLSKRITAV